ncbi:MAG: CBS domain-containing protein [Christensenellaceae bacterium]|jgi:predicted transcriptional regulator|nr:CBS domain-containing protein [Christensenellaceae bacterium]
MTNAERFIMAYNEIDYSLRTIYGFKRNITFADMIRKAVTLNAVVRKYEEVLIDYGRLRNSIVHKSNPDYVIAEPHAEVVEDFEKIAKLIKTPPTALEQVAKKPVICEKHSTPVSQLINDFTEKGFSNVPVYEDNKLIGIVRPIHIIKYIGQKMNDRNLQDCLRAPIKVVLPGEDERQYFKVADKTITIEKALNLFYIDRKLLAIIITERGSYNEMPLGIITTGDVLDMNAILENY